MKTYVFDIDGTICTNTFGKYDLASPYVERINFVNKLYEEGNYIKFFTARGSSTGIDWRDLTKKQLSKWGVLYHELILGKPEGDLYIDDKGYNCNRWIFPIKVEKENNQSQNINDKIFNFRDPILEHFEVLNKLISNEIILNQINHLCDLIKKSLKENGKVIFAGNGGSFADAQHLTAEFICRFKNNRVALPAITLGTNSSNLTAIGNDLGFEDIFSREFSAISNKKDVLIAISTSGNSRNIINLVNKAKSKGIKYYILTGETGGKLSLNEKNIVKIPSKDTATIQQIHILLGHMICRNIEIDYI